MTKYWHRACYFATDVDRRRQGDGPGQLKVQDGLCEACNRRRLLARQRQPLCAQLHKLPEPQRCPLSMLLALP